MNTHKTIKPKLRLKVDHIGPIMNLDDELSERTQNLIFATNGCGKTFIARTLRLLDSTAPEVEENISNPSNLVSEEGAIGNMQLTKGDTTLAEINLDTDQTVTTVKQGEHLFHVFSSDYLEHELRSKQYNLDGNIVHQIILGKENQELDQKEELLSTTTENRTKLIQQLAENFAEKRSDFQSNFAINGSLKEFRGLEVENCFRYEVPEKLVSLTEITKQYGAFKALPEDPVLPELPQTDEMEFDFNDLRDHLITPISASSVADEIKQKIKDDPEFYQTGLTKFADLDEECPFCTQEIGAEAATVIDAYVSYFEDAEATAYKELDQQIQFIEAVQKELSGLKKSYISAVSIYDQLKQSFPSIAETELTTVDELIDKLILEYEGIVETVAEKRSDLTKTDFDLNTETIAGLTKQLTDHNTSNLKVIKVLTNLVEQSDAQRLSIQRSACSSFLHDFTSESEAEIADVDTLGEQSKTLRQEIAELKKTTGDTISAREKVADTFSQLILAIFGGKYNFDPKSFVVQRNDTDMVRGGDKTLSDGEKSIIGLCYFLSQVHLKVESVDDYRRLFIVIDDPVSSVSFDYVYGVCQILKAMRVASDNITFNGGSDPKPNLLLLTHNDYFYNVVATNNVVHKNGLFQLTSNGATHQLRRQKNFVSPHDFHLKNVAKVAGGAIEPDFSTPNSIRCVLEGMGKFVRPDMDFSTFIEFAAKECPVEIKSVLINDLSHGGKFSTDSPLETDIKIAAAEVVAVVKKFAPGQLQNAETD